MRQKAYALIVENGRLLLVRYFYPKENAWFWNFPGGTLEPGETLEEALRRELVEECCVEVEVGPLLLKESLPDRDIVRYFFRCHIKSGRPRVSDNPATNDSIGALEWVDLTNPDHCGGWGRHNLPPIARALGVELPLPHPALPESSSREVHTSVVQVEKEDVKVTPVIHLQRQPWARWAAASLLLLWVLGLWAAQVDSGQPTLIPQFHIVFFTFWATLWGRGQSLMLVDHVLVVRNGPVVQRVPLAVAEIKALKQGWQIRWPDGRIWRRLTFSTPPAFREAVERAAEAARSADPATVPRTPAEAAGAVVLGYHARSSLPALLLVVGVVALVAAATWLQQPLLLLSLPAVPLFSDRLVLGGSDVVLAGEYLWLISPRQEIHGIPLRAIRGIRPANRSKRVLWIETDDPAYPVLRVSPQLGEAPFAQHLKRRMAGEPLVPPRSQPRPAEPDRAETVLRCSLCGRPEPGATAGGGVFICERCAGRAQYEANQAGHGLTGKEPKPL